MEEFSNNGGAPDIGDTLTELSALTLSSRDYDNSQSGNSTGTSGAQRNNDHKSRDIYESNEDVLFVGTNIRVKTDRDEQRCNKYDTGYQTSDPAHTDALPLPYRNDTIYDNYNNSNGTLDCNNAGGDPAVGNMYTHSMDSTAAGDSGNADGDEITTVLKMPCYSEEKPQTGFLLNFFRRKGAKATLKSIVKGKPVYNKVIDLDADSTTPCEYEDVNDALRQIVSTRSAGRAESVSGSVSNGSSTSNRRRRYHHNDHHHRHDHVSHRPYPYQPVVSVARMEPAQMGRFDFYGPGVTHKTDSAEYQPMTPDLFNGWVRAFFNVAVTTVLLYLGLVFILAISRDIGNGLEKRRQMVKAEAMLCQELYRKNKCRTVNVPALEQQCRDWEACMYKDAILYDDTSFLSAEVLGGVINKFVSQLDVRTVGIVIAAFLALFVGSNCALSMSGSPRQSRPGWFRRLFSRNRQPQDGSDILQGNGFATNPQVMHVMHNPYLQPNYCLMGNYPYVDNRYHSPTPPSTSLNYYNDKPDDEASWSTKSGPTTAWKRRFTSTWVDQN
ncbi:Nucleus export protein, putative [Babesia bigemina]|uniref:Nucleus export protein, putative n=1 Tax=Babesia bigemina TaxID=5866 RepID=A0A061D601_BABBI|nr:Nucleus export protein, putative [Babesia bigemina]CDR95988.1 Nucleus export protein, putative [Babesia bigemina]|eukprot:XP_012768174.1 Nucleus export protein, putative [Babesia bigemina]